MRVLATVIALAFIAILANSGIAYGQPGCCTPSAPAAGRATTPSCGGPALPSPGECVVTATGRIEIPFRVMNNHVLIPVSVNGSPPLDLILDTGMPMHGVMLHPGATVDRIAFNEDGAPRVVVAGGDDNIQRVATDVTCELPGVLLRGLMAVIAPSCGPGGTVAPDAAAGVIGLSVFDNFVVTFDHDRDVLVLTRPEDFVYTGAGARLPLKFDQGPVPQVDCAIESDGRTYPLSLVVDTGATFAISLSLKENGAIQLPSGARPLVLGYSYWGELTGHIGRGGTLRLGHLALDDILASYVEADGPGVPPCGDDGMLGNGTLRHFNATFDYSRKELILEPNSRTAEPFEFNMSGIVFDQTEDGDFGVLRVFPDTPGSEAGIEAGDVIVQIDGRTARDVPSETLREMFLRDQASVRLNVLRGAQARDVVVHLRRLV